MPSLYTILLYYYLSIPLTYNTADKNTVITQTIGNADIFLRVQAVSVAFTLFCWSIGSFACKGDQKFWCSLLFC
jgi:hypothetical protein